MARRTSPASAPSAAQNWAQMRAMQANTNYSRYASVRRGMKSYVNEETGEAFGPSMRDVTTARAEFVDPETDIYKVLPVSATDATYGPVDEGTKGRFDLAVDAFEWADEYFAYDDKGFTYKNLADDSSPTVEARDNAAAPLTIVPTNTINPNRPRTVAAGYDRDRRTITVVFRDGTFYNYYRVDPREWQAFRMSRSKGRYIRANLDGKPRGIAEVQAVPVTVRAALYNVARVGQVTGDERWQQADLIERYGTPVRQGRRRK